MYSIHQSQRKWLDYLFYYFKGSFSLILALKIKSMCFFVCVIVGFICICYLNNVAFFINKVLQLLPLGEGRKVLEKHKTTPKSFIFRDLKLQNKTTLTVYIIRWQETICITCKEALLWEKPRQCLYKYAIIFNYSL